MSQSSKKISDLLISIAVMIVLPAIVFLFGLNFFVERLQRQKEIQQLDNIRKNLFQIRSKCNNDSYIQKQLDFMCGFLAETEIEKDDMQKALNDFRAINGDFFNFRFFGSDKEPLKLKGESIDYRFLMNKIFHSLSSAELEENKDLLNENQEYFSAFLGENNPERVLSQKAVLLKATINGQPGYFYWNTLYSEQEDWKFKGGLVLYFKESQIPSNFTLKRVVDEFGKIAGNDFSYGYVDYRNLGQAIYIGGNSQQNSLDFSSAQIENALNEMRSELTATSKKANNLITYVRLNPHQDIFCIYQLVNHHLLNFLFILKLLLIGFFIFLTKLLFDNWHQNKFEDFFAKNRKSLSLAYMTAPALFLLIAGGIIQIYDVKNSYIQEYRGHLLAFANNIDDNYKSALKKHETNLGKFKDSLADFDKQNKNHTYLCQEFRNASKIKQILLIDKKGKVFYAYPGNTTSSPIFERLAPVLAAKFFDREKTGRKSFKNQLGDMIFDSFMEKFIPFLGNSENVSQLMKIFSTTDKLLEVNFTDKKYYIFTSIIKKSKEEANDFLLLSVTDATDFSKEFLSNQLKRNKKLNEEGRDGRQLAMIPRKRDQAPTPPEFSKYPFVFSMRERILSTESVQASLEDMAGQRTMVLATPLRYVPDYILFVINPVENMSRQMFMLGLELFVFVIVCLFISFNVGRWVVNFKK